MDDFGWMLESADIDRKAQRENALLASAVAEPAVSQRQADLAEDLILQYVGDLTTVGAQAVLEALEVRFGWAITVAPKRENLATD